MKTRFTGTAIACMFLFISCASQVDSYRWARKKHTIKAYKEYLKKYPDGKFVDDAKENIAEILAFREAMRSDLTEKYRQFLKDYPDSQFSPHVKRKLFCLENKLADQDGNVYNIIIIGDQIWMAENLKVAHYRNGDPIPNVTSPDEWKGLSTGARCVYDNEERHADTYGYLYNWHAVTDSRNIAPEGWHVPNDKDWWQLDMHLGISRLDMILGASNWIGEDEGGKMKETGTMHWNSPNTGATNESGLSARPGGMRGNNGHYEYIGTGAFFWSASMTGFDFPWYHMLSSTSSWIYRHYHHKNCGFSVRCVRDETI